MFLTYVLLSPENVRYWVKVFLGGWFRLLDLYATNTVKQYKRYIMSKRPSSILSFACHSRHLWCRKKPHSGIEVGFMISEDFCSWELVNCLSYFMAIGDLLIYFHVLAVAREVPITPRVSKIPGYASKCALIMSKVAF